MAVEWAGYGIRANAIAPGSIATPRSPDTPQRQAEVGSSLIPFKRSGEADDIGKAALFLSSDMARYVTGQTLAVDGGWMAAFLLNRDNQGPVRGR
jgi:NAD(P)-dependent dehydrogenase (short-subunit alcohol dehydrogenase family)